MEEDNIAGRHSGPSKPEMKAGLKVDVEAIKRLDGELVKVKDTAKSIADELERAAKASKNITPQGGAGANTAQNGMPMGTNSSPPVGSTSRAGGFLGGGGAGSGGGAGGAGGGGGGITSRIGGLFGGGAGTGAGLLAGAAVGAIGGQIMSATDRRIDENRAYALPASRLGVATQLRTGMTERQYIDYRKQIVGDKGDRSINVDPNALISFENTTGISAIQQRQSVGALRALSGYSQTTGDVLGMMQQNLDPSTVNRQARMMGGLTMYGPGGKPRDYMSLLNARVGMFQLDDRNISEGALRQGSVSRYRMSMMGIGQDEQDTLIQLGQAQSTFREKGGKGTFDPTSEEDRKIAGVEDTFATQFDETERLRAKKNEDMYSRQADNYADLEKSNQQLITALNAVEEKLSGLIGARVSGRNWMNIGGRLLQGAGLGVMAATGWTGAGAVIGGGMMAGGTMLSTGDGTESKGGGTGAGIATTVSNSSGSSKTAANDNQIKVPLGGTGQKKSLNEIKARYDFRQMHPKMQDRLLSAMRENPNLGWGGGFRDSKAQETMFLQRYEPTNDDKGVKYKGKYWKRVRGAAAAPPGRSMHEIGLAADMAGDTAWLVKNAARFGLKTFHDVNNEPWHAQPIELPNSRRQYEEQGAIWGTNGAFDETAVFTEEPGTAGPLDEAAEVADEHPEGGGGAGGGAAGGGMDFTGMSISQVVDMFQSGAIGGGQSSAGGHSKSSGKSGIGNTSSTSYGDGYANVAGADNFDGPVSSGAQAAAKAAFAAGFRGDALRTIVAIAGRESGWQSDAKNPNTSDRGMWQINWSNFSRDSYKDFRKANNINNENDLLDVNKNAAAAYKMYQDSVNSGKPFFPWRASDKGYKGVRGWDPNGDPLWHTDKFVGEATTAATAVMNSSGDPTDSARKPVSMPRAVQQAVPSMSTGGSGRSVTNQYQIDFSPVFKFEGMPQTPQLRQVAQEAATLMREQLDIAVRRSE